jgi:glutamyl-tRNA reductase
LSLHVLLIGANHTSAPVALRERLAISGDALSDALSRFGQSNGHGPTLLPEGIILSTCNRLEIYAVAEDIDRGYAALVEFLSQDRAVPVEEFAASLYVKFDADAATHLARVACGLDSLVVGEPQILGQVTAAYQAALDQGATGPVLNALFQHAIQAGKRAHTETPIGQNAASVPAAAALLAERALNGLPGRQVLVLGAGEMGQAAARALLGRGVTGIVVANRTYERALKLACELGGEALAWERRGEGLARADIVITATNAPQAVLTPGQVTAAMAQRPARPLFIVDIAVPRDADPAVADIPGVHLFDIDDLECVVQDNIEARQQAIPRVAAIADAEASAFLSWFRALEAVPTIADLRQRAKALEAQEVEKALRRLGNLSDQERAVVQVLAHRLVNKLLHEPTVRLKYHAAQGDAYLYTGVVRELFGLEGGSQTSKVKRQASGLPNANPDV